MQNTREAFLEAASDHKIICFGAGKVLQYILDFFYANHLKINKLIDNSKKLQGSMIENCEVQSPDILKSCNGNEYIVLISSKNFAREIHDQIDKLCPNKFTVFRWPLLIGGGVNGTFDEVLWKERIYGACMSTYKEIAKNREDELTYLKEKEMLLGNKKNLILPRTPLMITTRCTLRCRECSNLMPYYSLPKDYDSDEIIQWIRNISSAVDEWTCCGLVGGEPFLYRDLEKVLSYALTEPKIQQVEFTTNASVIPKPDVLRLMADDRVIVNISEYPNIIDSTRFISVLEEYGVHYHTMRNMRWTRTKNLEKRNRSYEKLQSQYLNCGPAKMCRTILNGKLYVCSKAASLAELGKADRLEYVDQHLRVNISDFLRLTFSNACDYCDMASADEEIIEAAVQLSKMEESG